MEVSILDEEVGFECAIDREKGIIMGRLKKDQDFLEGIIAVCQFYNIQSATFNGIGSLAKLGYYQFEQRSDGTLYYSEPICKDEPGELLSGNGFIGLDEHNQLDVHYHGMYVDKNGNISGGHFIRGKNPTAVTIEFTIHYTNEIHLQRKPDSTYNIPIFHFSERGS